MDTTKIKFVERAKQFQQIAADYNKKHNKISVVRTIAFIVAAVALVYFANARNLEVLLIIAVIFPLLFGLIVKKHHRIRYQRAQFQYLKEINEQELFRLQGNLSSFDDGNRFVEEHHPYIQDLDIFGKNSLFQLLNRCGTELGKFKLAAWLKSAANNEEIKLRQDAVQALVSEIDWRQEFQAAGKHYEEDPPEEKSNNTTILLQWINSPNLTLNKSWYTIAGYLMPLITLLLIFLFFFYSISYLFPLAGLLLNALIMKKVSPEAQDAYEKTYKSIQSLKAYAAMIEKIEAKDFEAEKLGTLKQSFHHDQFSASAEIKKLERILDKLETRGNGLYILFNLIFLLDIHFLRKAEKWKKDTKADLSQWFDALSEFEALNSMAGMYYANPDYNLPVVNNKNHVFSATSLGHPLLQKEKRVCNDFLMAGRGKIIVLTGSNMSGKSTFLRTLGTNAVLALMGAPVCAQKMEIFNMQVFTSMRTEDSLKESVSSFYAELKRLRQLLDVIEEGHPVFFMLDEILKGTNSHDRHNGAAALIKQLSEKNSCGLVSTHDLELGSLAKESSNIQNLSFTSQIIHDEIIFDYKLHEGICQSFNASQLMEKMGIDMRRVKN